MTEELVMDVCLYIDKHIGEMLTIDDIADEFHFNKFYLMRKFKENTGLTINQYINKQKIHSSMYEITYTNDSMLKIALNNGFNSLEYFSEQFTRIIGISPSKFRSFSLEYGVPPFDLGGKDMNKLEQIRADLAELKRLKEMIVGNQNQNVDTAEIEVAKEPAKVLVKKQDKKAA